MQKQQPAIAANLSEETSRSQQKKQYGQVRLSAMNMLCRREQSRKELQNKLGTRFDQQLVNQVLDELQQQGLQSDERFVESFVAARVQRGQGPLKISYDLQNKGICSEVISMQLQAYATAWLELAKRVLQRKFGEQPPADHTERQKQQRFIAGRGFPDDICYRVFD